MSKISSKSAIMSYNAHFVHKYILSYLIIIINFDKVKIFKVILLLFLVLKSTMGLSISFDCCPETNDPMQMHCQDAEQSQNESEDKGCCNSVCDCLCCGHIFTFQRALNLQLNTNDYTSNRCTPYLRSFKVLFGDNMWQPPRQV